MDWKDLEEVLSTSTSIEELRKAGKSPKKFLQGKVQKLAPGVVKVSAIRLLHDKIEPILRNVSLPWSAVLAAVETMSTGGLTE